MVGSQQDYEQPDHDPRIQHVLLWKRSPDTWRLGSGGVDNALDRRFIPKSILKATFSQPGVVEGLLQALFSDYTRSWPDPDTIRSRYLRPFVILLCVGQGHMILHFVEHESLQDRHLPFRSEPPAFPTSTARDLWADFYKEQWTFCATTLDRYQSYHLEEDEILPIIEKERLGEGGSAITHKVKVHEDYDHLDPTDSNHDHKGVYVVKTYRTSEAQSYFDTERDAFKNLKKAAGRSPPNIIGFHGSFVRGDCFNIILEYAEMGTLEDFMKTVQQPSSSEDTIMFWDRFTEVMHGLVTIHGTSEGDSSEPQMLLGWHQDVKPRNILVKKRSATSPYDCHFKLADLGLSHFKRHIGSQQGATDGDAFGTHAYGAPETCRMDRALQGSPLQVKQEVDIWSMGCVYSEVATWVGHGWNKVEEYRRRRRKEFREKNSIDGECFHDGSNMLDTVEQIHSELLTNRRISDHVTPSVLEHLVQNMMIASGSRLPAKFIFEKSKRIIQEANTKVSEERHHTIQPGWGYTSPADSLSRLPPNLPPDFGSGTGFQNPFNHASHGDFRTYNLAINRSFPRGRPFSRDSRYESPLPHSHGYLSSVHSGDHANSQFSPDRPGRVFSDPSGVQDDQQPSITSNGQRNNLLHYNRFNTIMENGSKTVDESQRAPRRQTRNFPLEEAQGLDNWPEDHFRRLVDINPSGPSSPSTTAITPPRHSHSQETHSISSPNIPTLALNHKRHPMLLVDKGLLWKTDRDLGRNHKLENEELLEDLKGRDHAFLIDNAESMAPHWPQVVKVFELLSYMVQNCDPNGLDLYFTNTSKAFKSRNVTSLVGELKTRIPAGFPDTRMRFGSIIENYQEKFGKKSLRSLFRGSTSPRKLSLYVFTDGVWQPKIDLTTTIKTLVKSLVEHKLTNKQIGIQFIRFGNDEEGIKRLQKLDSGLCLDLDIIDTTSADGNVWKMLLGAVNDWFDDD